jgi:hypothetical protein
MSQHRSLPLWIVAVVTLRVKTVRFGGRVGGQFGNGLAPTPPWYPFLIQINAWPLCRAQRHRTRRCNGVGRVVRLRWPGCSCPRPFAYSLRNAAGRARERRGGSGPRRVSAACTTSSACRRASGPP